MIRPPSNQNYRDAFWSGDPAFVQLAPNATDEQKEAHARLWQVAKETGNYSGLIIQGQTPTKFVFKPMAGETYFALQDDLIAGRVGMLVATSIAFRATIIEVVGFEKPRPAETKYGTIATGDITNTLHEAALGCIFELGLDCLNRAAGIAGK